MSKDRLVELIQQVAEDVTKIPTDNFIEYLADHLLANGLIVPTYNIGQTVYTVVKGDDLWWKGTVASICYEFNEMSYEISFDDGDFAMFEEEYVFPTREEAEAKLKENKRL